MTGKDIDQNGTVSLAQRFAKSARFSNLFTSGMDLVEETASFLDSDGREKAKGLSRSAAAIYGAESMRLTTRLMQLASWLLLQRAVAEGEMTFEQVIDEKKNVKLNKLQTRDGGPGWDELPSQFLDLVDRSVTLQKRIMHLDEEIYGDGSDKVAEAENPVASQHELLKTAFANRFAG